MNCTDPSAPKKVGLNHFACLHKKASTNNDKQVPRAPEMLIVETLLVFFRCLMK